MKLKVISAGAIAVILLLVGSHFEAAHAASSRVCDAWARDYATNASRQGHRRFAAGSSAACWALASEQPPGAPVPAPPSEGALGPYQEPTRGSALRIRSIGLLIGTAWQGGFASRPAFLILPPPAVSPPWLWRPLAWSCCNRTGRVASG
jgi:hypothetical protein